MSDEALSETQPTAQERQAEAERLHQQRAAEVDATIFGVLEAYREGAGFFDKTVLVGVTTAVTRFTARLLARAGAPVTVRQILGTTIPVVNKAAENFVLGATPEPGAKKEKARG